MSRADLSLSVLFLEGGEAGQPMSHAKGLITIFMWRSSAERDVDDLSPPNLFFVFIDTATFLRQLSLLDTISPILVNTRASSMVYGLLVY